MKQLIKKLASPGDDVTGVDDEQNNMMEVCALENGQKEMNEAEKMRYLREQYEKMDDSSIVIGHQREHM